MRSLPPSGPLGGFLSRKGCNKCDKLSAIGRGSGGDGLSDAGVASTVDFSEMIDHHLDTNEAQARRSSIGSLGTRWRHVLRAPKIGLRTLDAQLFGTEVAPTW